MSKVSFRARAMDAFKPMPVYKASEIPDMKDFAQINRSVLQMPTGMEKEEETEHHLQRALSAQQVYGSSGALVIPIPEVQDISKRFHALYPDTYKLSKQYIHVQALSMDQEIPDYDMDSDDDMWLTKQMGITPLKFEEMMDRLEKGSGQQMATLKEAKLLLKDDDDLILAVYNYWLNKRLQMQQPVKVKSEKKEGTSNNNNPYVAFRRRTEKMQTRKNRKNDEVSYEKMLKLRRDLQKTITLLELLKRREKSKKELLQLTIEVIENRNEMEDFSGAALARADEEREKHPTFVSPFALEGHGEWNQTCNGEELSPVRKKRRYRKRKHLQQQTRIIPHTTLHPQFLHHQSSCDVDIMDSSDDDVLSPALSQSDHDDDDDPDGMFAFKRRNKCCYHQPLQNGLGNWPWHGAEEGGRGHSRYCFSLTSLPTGCVGYARRRIGRGGRVIFDRGSTPWDEALEQLDFSYSYHHSNIYSDYIVYVRDNKIPCYRQKPRSPGGASHSAGASNVPGGGSTGDSVFGRQSSQFDVESFHSHREQLLHMQREQQQRLFIDNEHNTTAMLGLEPTRHLQDNGCQFTLDSASATFAVQALLEPTHLGTLPILEGTTPSSLRTAQPVASRTGLHQFNFALANKASNSVGFKSSNINTIVSSVSSSATHSATVTVSSSPSVSLLQKSSSASFRPQKTSLLQPPIIVSNTSTSLTVPTSVLSSIPFSSSTTFLLSKTNGPLTSSSLLVRSSGLSSSSATNVLQLSFPVSSASLITLTPSSSLSSLSSQPVRTGPSYSSSVIATSTMASATTTVAALQFQSPLNNKVTPSCSTSTFYKLPVSAPISNFDLLRPNHEEILFGKDTGIPMDVT